MIGCAALVVCALGYGAMAAVLLAAKADMIEPAMAVLLAAVSALIRRSRPVGWRRLPGPDPVQEAQGHDRPVYGPPPHGRPAGLSLRVGEGEGPVLI